MADSVDTFECSICLQLLQDPVTAACGHNYCLACINSYWDSSNNKGKSYFCPQCRESFYPRPALKKNTLLCDLVEEHRRSTGQGDTGENAAAAAAAAAAGGRGTDAHEEPGLPCDVCRGTSRRASMFCCVCLVSYCDDHLRPHFEVPPLKKHSLIPASTRAKESVCRRHNRLVEIYCRTSQQFICLMCAVEDHKDHDTVTVAARQSEIQRELDETVQSMDDRMLKAKAEMLELNNAADNIRNAAWEASNEFERLCEEYIHSVISSVKLRCDEMRGKVLEAEKAGVDWIDGHLRRRQHEVRTMEKRIDKINHLALITEPIQFIQEFQRSDLKSPKPLHGPLDHLTQFVAAQEDKIKNLSKKETIDIYDSSKKYLLLKMPRLPEAIITRTKLLAKYTDMEMNPNTVGSGLCLSNNNRELSWSGDLQTPPHPHHQDRFTFYPQALCTKGLEGNHYWEVEWDGGVVEVAVAYRGINRQGSGKDCCFGHNRKSWKLICSSSGCTFWHNSLHRSNLLPAKSCRVGVHLDFNAGKLVFYSVTDELILLHQTQTTFNEPVYPGFSVDLGATLKICSI